MTLATRRKRTNRWRVWERERGAAQKYTFTRGGIEGAPPRHKCYTGQRQLSHTEREKPWERKDNVLPKQPRVVARVCVCECVQTESFVNELVRARIKECTVQWGVVGKYYFVFSRCCEKNKKYFVRRPSRGPKGRTVVMSTSWQTANKKRNNWSFMRPQVAWLWTPLECTKWVHRSLSLSLFLAVLYQNESLTVSLARFYITHVQRFSLFLSPRRRWNSCVWLGSKWLPCLFFTTIKLHLCCLFYWGCCHLHRRGLSIDAIFGGELIVAALFWWPTCCVLEFSEHNLSCVVFIF